MHLLLLADGDAPDRSVLDTVWPGWDDDVARVIAADGGARHAAGLGRPIDHWVGDGDSLGPSGVAALQAEGIRVDLASTDKDASDTELALDAAIVAGATRITVVGALGGQRLDHALANIALLAIPELAGRDVRLVAAAARIRLIAAPGADGRPVAVELDGRVGDLVSLFPVDGDVEGITTRDLRYPLRAETLALGRARGLSNVRTAASAGVSVSRGRLLVIETPATI
jgi:thiamine pyrophosphokinase